MSEQLTPGCAALGGRRQFKGTPDACARAHLMVASFAHILHEHLLPTYSVMNALALQLLPMVVGGLRYEPDSMTAKQAGAHSPRIKGTTPHGGHGFSDARQNGLRFRAATLHRYHEPASQSKLWAMIAHGIDRGRPVAPA